MTPTKSPSPAQIAANLANAQKSTGPKTDAGRNASKMNAVKHGIFSSEVLVRGRHFKENPEEFAALHQRLGEDYLPVGVAEEMLVDQLATTFWRLRRLQQAEAGEIAISVDRHLDGLKPADHNLLRRQWKNAGNIEIAMMLSLEGNYLMQSQLNAVRKDVVEKGELNSQAIALVHLDDEPYGLAIRLQELLAEIQKNPWKLNADALRVSQKEQVLDFLDKELVLIGERIEIFKEREKAADEAQKAAAMVPSREVMDRLGPYETRLRRQFNTALRELERLQRDRRHRDDSPFPSQGGNRNPLVSFFAKDPETEKRTQSPLVNQNLETPAKEEASLSKKSENVKTNPNPQTDLESKTVPIQASSPS